MALSLTKEEALNRTYNIGKMGKTARIMVPKSLIGMTVIIREALSNTIIKNAKVCSSHKDLYGRITLNLENLGKIVELEDFYKNGISKENVIRMYIQEHRTKEEIVDLFKQYDNTFDINKLNSFLGKQ